MQPSMDPSKLLRQVLPQENPQPRVADSEDSDPSIAASDEKLKRNNSDLNSDGMQALLSKIHATGLESAPYM